MGSLLVVLQPKAVEGALLGGERGPGRSNRAALQGLVHAFVGPVLLRVGGQNPLVLNAQAQPPDIQGVSPCSEVEARGTPLSVRIARGRPYSRNRRSKMGRTPVPLVESRPWQASR